MNVRWRAASGAVLAALLAAGCSNGIEGTFLPNAHPIVELSHAPASATNRYFYAYEFKWFGYDTDGEIDHFVYAVDPPTAAGAETTWIATRKYAQVVEFSASTADTAGPPNHSFDYHTFVIKAVDNRGLASAPVSRSFNASTIAPFAQITNPRPVALTVVRVAPTARISWDGDDPDGVHTRKPVKYKWTLLSSSSPVTVGTALLDPDSLRRYYAPHFAGWDSTDADTRSVQLESLAPGGNYIFAVVAFDEAGAYSSIFSLNSNMLRFRADFANTLGPRITFMTPFFTFTYPNGGYSLDPNREIMLEILPDRPLSIQWSATPPEGTSLRAYRWKVDGDVGDETPRESDADHAHWSAWSLFETSAVVGPFGGGETHRFYLEVEDDNGGRSIGILRIHTIDLQTSFTRELLIVDDTRMAGDQAGPGCVRAPIGAWPTAAELDTFLYARGGVPWRCYPAGTISTPGLFAGYAYDTLGTRPQTFAFTTLAQYRHVIWLLDPRGALQGGSGFGSSEQETSLRYMTGGQGRINSLAAYLEAGGKVWFVGGGVAVAARQAFMRSYMRWSTFRATTGGAFITRSDRLPLDDPNAPPLARLPMRLDAKTSLTDPFPPGRAGQSQSVFYRSLYEFEYMNTPNAYTEPDPDDPEIQRAVLDTLLKISGIGLPTPSQNPENVVMTSYRGFRTGHVVFNGHDLWTFRRTQLVELIDFVLQDVWGFPARQP